MVIFPWEFSLSNMIVKYEYVICDY